ncbi:phenolphthiocerol synthesis polyketide synthase type I Pks15/1 [Elysia marginata]|uniref:Phenolphthiocerol synthesis polyketide synthase type I Pks15/1 n=1 Tax=Elysia marginata TaxID=1093978 RepID=A0AAV4H2P3_9GAST|nr:phenolphthiocerol synthesis polyketide synthase type I Pks15/1 [Elysia marginata]
MESVGSVRIFSRSEEQRGLRYTEHLGDGDAAAFRKVAESCPYGEDVQIVKLECVGHVQKRCDTRLRRLKNENKTVKLEDGKGLGGAGRLTDKKIDTLQNY